MKVCVLLITHQTERVKKQFKLYGAFYKRWANFSEMIVYIRENNDGHGRNKNAKLLEGAKHSVIMRDKNTQIKKK